MLCTPKDADPFPFSLSPLPPKESASGILYLHTVGIIHRDIKPANILIGGKAKTSKIADFGISRVANVGATMTVKGTLLYQAPEVSREERYSFPADVFSFAITMYELCDRVSSLIFDVFLYKGECFFDAHSLTRVLTLL